MCRRYLLCLVHTFSFQILRTLHCIFLIYWSVGYHANKLKTQGYEDGIVRSWYFVPEDRKHEMEEYRAVRKPIYMREFPTSWRKIDYGIEELHKDLPSVSR